MNKSALMSNIRIAGTLIRVREEFFNTKFSVSYLRSFFDLEFRRSSKAFSVLKFQSFRSPKAFSVWIFKVFEIQDFLGLKFQICSKVQKLIRLELRKFLESESFFGLKFLKSGSSFGLKFQICCSSKAFWSEVSKFLDSGSFFGLKFQSSWIPETF